MPQRQVPSHGHKGWSSIPAANGIIQRVRRRAFSTSACSKGFNRGERKMWNSSKSTMMPAAFLVAIAVSGPVAQAKAEASSDGIVTVKSDYSVAETVSRIKKDVAEKGIMFFGVIDQADLGNAAGNQVLPSRLVMFGNPALGTTFITANQKAGLDWPVRVLVYQDSDGRVHASYTDLDWIAKRHGIQNRDQEFKMATEVIRSVTASVRK
jgi:uncharacterized protein (DUF302 family)